MARKGGNRCRECEPHRVSRNVEIKVSKAVNEQAATCNCCAEVNPARLSPQIDSEIPERGPEKQHQRPENKDTAKQSGFSQALQVVIVGVLSDEILRTPLIARKGRYERA